MSQMVQVVSMEEVPRRFRSVSFQSKDVSGAQNSLFLFCAHHNPCTAAVSPALNPKPERAPIAAAREV